VSVSTSVDPSTVKPGVSVVKVCVSAASGSAASSEPMFPVVPSSMVAGERLMPVGAWLLGATRRKVTTGSTRPARPATVSVAVPPAAGAVPRWATVTAQLRPGPSAVPEQASVTTENPSPASVAHRAAVDRARSALR
jgi:hypothetical protein